MCMPIKHLQDKLVCGQANTSVGEWSVVESWCVLWGIFRDQVFFWGQHNIDHSTWRSANTNQGDDWCNVVLPILSSQITRGWYSRTISTPLSYGTATLCYMHHSSLSLYADGIISCSAQRKRRCLCTSTSKSRNIHNITQSQEKSKITPWGQSCIFEDYSTITGRELSAYDSRIIIRLIPSREITSSTK